jgi:hypothetical protein
MRGAALAAATAGGISSNAPLFLAALAATAGVAATGGATGAGFADGWTTLESVVAPVGAGACVATFCCAGAAGTAGAAIFVAEYSGAEAVEGLFLAPPNPSN